MASFLTFLGKAKSIAGAFKSILGGDAECVFVLEGDGGKVQFPVNPAEFEVGNPYENTRININSLGEINMKGKRGLKTLKFSSFFPANDYEWLNSGTLFGNLTDSNAGDPYGNIAKIRQIAESDKPAKISISGTDVSMDCLIDDFSYKEQDGSGDVYFSLEVSEYRHIGPESGALNDTTGLKGTVAQADGVRNTTVARGMDAMDSATRAVSRTTSIVNQAQRKLGAFRSIVKSGGIPAGTIIRTTASSIKAGKLDLHF